jgi:NADH-quinone oxidoreductase subunit J
VPMTLDLIPFLVLSLIALSTALGMLLSRNAIYSALFLVLNFVTVAVFYLFLSAPFIAMAQITVYAGAIMVLFLFVIMLLGAERSGPQQAIPWQRPVAVILGLLLVAEVGYILLSQVGVIPASTQEIPETFGSPVTVGLGLFTSYLLPFEVTSVLLLVAIIGAIVLTKVERNPDQERK